MPAGLGSGESPFLGCRLLLCPDTVEGARGLFNEDTSPIYRGLPGGSDTEESVCKAGDRVQSLGQEDPLQKKMAIHVSILAWRMSWTAESGRFHGVTKSQTRLSD